MISMRVNEIFSQLSKNEELKKKCQQCMEIILSAKARQAAEANKYATILLEEIDAERTREESKKAAQARKREKKKAKKRERLEKEKLEGKDGGRDEDKADDDDDDDEDAKPESVERVSSRVGGGGDKNDVAEEVVSTKPDRPEPAQSRVSATYSADYVEAILTEMRDSVVQNSMPAEDKSGDNESQGDGKRSRTRRKNRARPKARDGTARDEIMHDSAPLSQQQVIGDSRPKTVTSSKTVPSNAPLPEAAVAAPVTNFVDSNKTAPVANAIDMRTVKTTAAVVPDNRVVSRHAVEANGRPGVSELDDFAAQTVNGGRSRTSPGKTDSKLAIDKNLRLALPERTAVSQSVSPVKSGMSNKPTNTPTPKKGSRKEEDWKEVVRKSRRMTLPSNVAGRIIGRNGSHLHAIRHYTGAHLEVDKIRGSNDRLVTIKGTPEAIKHAADIVTALITKSDKEVEQLLTKMKNKLASSTNPADLAVLDLEGKTLGRSLQQTSERVNLVPSSAMPTSSVPNTIITSKQTSYQPLVSSTSFSIGVWEMPSLTGGVNTTAKNGADTKTTNSCARQLFPTPAEQSSANSQPATTIARTTPTYASSSASKTKVVTALSATPSIFTDTNAAGSRFPVSQGQPVSSLPLVSPLRSDQPPLPIKPSAGMNSAENRPTAFSSVPHTGFTTEYSPFSGGLMTDVLVGKKDDANDGKMNFASVAAAGVVGKNQSPTAQMGGAMLAQNGNADTDSLEDLKAKAPGYKPQGQRSMPSPQTIDGKPVKGKMPGLFYTQSQISPSMAAISISMPEQRFDGDGRPLELHHGPLTPGEYYDKVMASSNVDERAGVSSHSNTSTPASSQSPRSSTDTNKQRKDEYANPHQPMTLPKVESRLNPEAPDFTLPAARQNPVFPPFASFMMSQGFPPMADMTSMPPPDMSGMFGQPVNAAMASQMPPYGRMPVPPPFAPFNMPAPAPLRPAVGRPPSREGSPNLGMPVSDGSLSVGPPGFISLGQAGFMPPGQSAFMGQSQSPERSNHMPRPIGTGRRNVGAVGQAYGSNIGDRPPPAVSQTSWSTGNNDTSSDFLQSAMLQSAMMITELGGAPGDLALGASGMFGQTVMSAAAYNIDPLADLANVDDPKMSQPFGQAPGRRPAMYVNGGSAPSYTMPGLGLDRFDTQPSSNPPWSSGNDSDMRLGGWLM